MIHDGEVIVESSVICEYLDELWPSPPLMPAGPCERARPRAWMRYIEEVPTASIRVAPFNKLFVSANGRLSKDEF
jgi:glutathione S-transferase